VAVWWYGQDRWQLTKKLTLNAGLRYELLSLMTREKSASNGSTFTNNTLYMGGRGNVPTNAGISVNKLLFAPRLGLAYRATDNTVLRAGYGMTYDPLPFSARCVAGTPIPSAKPSLRIPAMTPVRNVGSGNGSNKLECKDGRGLPDLRLAAIFSGAIAPNQK